MKLFILHVFLLLLTSARSAFAGVIPDSDFGRRESKEGEIDAMDENMALDARAAQLPVVPIVIAALAIGNIVLGQTLHTLKTKGAAEVRPPSNDKEASNNPPLSASELLQKSVNWVSQNSDFSAVAIRGGVSTSVGFDGDFGKDWQSSVVTIDAAEGQSHEKPLIMTSVGGSSIGPGEAALSSPPQARAVIQRDHYVESKL
ncbi:hypothetical protein CVT26_011987 [Gymnopilus dilepis]|uniref:Uncharacterized protein n=1 Tax=Gymnopilus dilepis TaxID=231916 RepID=A0A409VYP0_9AGAR|nr:hypothetical protein CVT26_011987 [Gymnopilus dilepis]